MMTEPVPIYIIAGQSNAAGFYQREMFAQALLDNGVPGVVLGSYAGGRTFYPSQTLPDYYPFDDGDPNTGELYDQLFVDIRQALGTIQGSYLAGIVWIHGESDSTPAAATGYQASLQRFYDGLTAEFGDTFKLLVSGLSTYIDGATVRSPYWNMVRNAQIAVAAANENVLFIDTDLFTEDRGLSNAELFYDAYHFTDDGLKLIAEAMIDRLAPDYSDIRPTGLLNAGIGGLESATGAGYMMFSTDDLYTRFDLMRTSGGSKGASQHFVPVRYDAATKQWYADTNAAYVAFTPRATDVLVAAIDFTGDTITDLKGRYGSINGINLGYAAGDLTFYADRFLGVYNDAEFEITGNWLELHGRDTVGLHDLRAGIAGRESVTGTGYILYSEESLYNRMALFRDGAGKPAAADHFVSVMYDTAKNQWYYDDNAKLVAFTPHDGDLIVAQVNHGAGTVQSLQGTLGEIGGIRSGYVAGDLTIVANQWAGLVNKGEFGISGTWFEAHDPSFVPVGAIRYGIAGRENPTGEGYVLYTDRLVSERFSAFTDAQGRLATADHFIAVVYDPAHGQWYYDDNAKLVAFTPEAGDLLVARLDFDRDTAASLRGVSFTLGGIAAGYRDGDLVVHVDRWGGTANQGEFDLSGSWIQRYPEGRIVVDDVRAGIAARDNATGTGYLLYSAENVYDRLAPFTDAQGRPAGADQFIVVIHDSRTNQWFYDDNAGYVAFQPRDSDRLVAAIDFSHDRIISLERQFGEVDGIKAGYSAGDLQFFANQWAGLPNAGEFDMTGTWFVI